MATGCVTCASAPRWQLRSWSCRRRSRGFPAAFAVQHQAELSSPHTVDVAEERQVNDLGSQLRQWVEDAGGYVHPALQLSLASHYGRGVIATDAIPTSQAQQQPLIVVPEQLLLTTEAAAARLGPLLQPAAQQRQPWWALSQRWQEGQLPDPTLLLALLLATERRQGASSFWWPYIAALPEEVPCGWALTQPQLEAALSAMGGMAAGWEPQVRAAADAVQHKAAAAAAAYGEQLELSAADVRWALGQVLSRSFGSGADLAMLPFIDLCNHQQHAATPAGFTTAAGQPCASIWSSLRGSAQQLAAGDELFISYVAGTSPLSMFLNFGFCPDEHRQQQQN